MICFGQISKSLDQPHWHFAALWLADGHDQNGGNSAHLGPICLKRKFIIIKIPKPLSPMEMPNTNVFLFTESEEVGRLGGGPFGGTCLRLFQFMEECSGHWRQRRRSGSAKSQEIGIRLKGQQWIRAKGAQLGGGGGGRLRVVVVRLNGLENWQNKMRKFIVGITNAQTFSFELLWAPFNCGRFLLEWQSRSFWLCYRFLETPLALS
jgi:hypothetical protein